MDKDFYYVAKIIHFAEGNSQLDMCKNCAELFLETHCNILGMVRYSSLLDLISKKLK